MKTKLTLTIDKDLLPIAKKFARMKRVSLSSLIESELRKLTAPGTLSFAEKWRGKFISSSEESDRYKFLSERYL